MYIVDKNYILVLVIFTMYIVMEMWYTMYIVKIGYLKYNMKRGKGE